MRHFASIYISLKCMMGFAVTAISDSPYSPHHQLSVLVDNMQHLKQEVDALKQMVSMTDAPVNEVKSQVEQQAKLEQDNIQQIRSDILKKYDEANVLINELKAENENLNKEVVEQKQKNEVLQAELEEQKSKICKLEEQGFVTQDTEKQNKEALEKKIAEQLADLLKQCQKLCADTINQTNDRLQDLARQVQQKIDQLKPVEIKHTISSGESLSSIARRYNTTAEAILKLNNLSTAKTLRVGDMIWISK